MGNFIASLTPGSDEDIESMGRVLEQKVDNEIHYFSTDRVSLLSSRPHIDQGELKVAFNGYLTVENDTPEEHVAELYRDKGEDFVQHLDGSFRLILYDTEKDVLHATADKVGRKVIYRVQKGDRLACSSHLTPLLVLDMVENRIDTTGLADFLRSWSVSFGGGPRLIEGVERIYPSHLLTFSGGESRQRKFWDVYNRREDVTDRDAEKRLEKLLKEGTRRILDATEGDVPVFFSGGLDSTVLTALLREATERPIHTYTWGWNEEHFEDAREMAERFGTVQHDIELSYDLPGAEETWFYEEPHNAFLRYPFKELYEEGMQGYWTGLNSQATFPVCLQNVRKLDRYRSLEPLVKVSPEKIDGAFGRFSYRYAKGLEAFRSPYRSTAIASDWGLRQCDADRMLSRSLREKARGLLPFMDQAWGLEPRSYQENYSYMQLRARDTARYAYYAQDLEHYDVFGYVPLVEFSYSLPMKQKKNRRLLQRIARDRVPEKIITKGASGWDFVSRQMRRKMSGNRDTYERTIERFLDRGYVDEEESRGFLLPDKFPKERGKVNQMAAVFLLEQWIETFIDRDASWKMP